MRTSTKIGIIGIAVSAITAIVIGTIEINDARKGKKRLHKDDIKLIADSIVAKQEEVKLAKKKVVKPIVNKVD